VERREPPAEGPVERSEPSGEAEAREGSRSGSGHFWSARSCGGSWRQELGSTIFLIKIKSKFLRAIFSRPFFYDGTIF
jgi:hypothetical protein